MKTKVLVAYNEMMVGGSTTSLLALLNALEPDRYDVDLQLYRNRGPLLDQIPSHVHLMPPAFMHEGRLGKVIKIAKGVFSGALLRARLAKKRLKKHGYSGQVLSEFQAKWLSRRPKGEYDIAIGYLEGWSDRYIAYCVKAKKKFGWLHSTFANLAEVPELEMSWMDRVDHIVMVADNCRDDFVVAMPGYAHKAITIPNIVDSALLRKRAELTDENDEAYLRFRDADCFKLVTVCRLAISTKGLDRAVSCAKQLKEMGRRFLWVIVGDGGDMEEFKGLVKQADLSDCMVAVGNRMNPLPFIKEADVFCMLSRYEGKPMVVTESMILGTPPLVTRYLSANEQIKHGVEGLIVDNGEDTALPAILDCMDSPEIVRGMKEYLLQHEYGNREYIHTITQTYFC